MTWPYPGDSPVVRARRVAWMYRLALQHCDPDRCKELDERMRVLEQAWAIPRHTTLDLTDWVDAHEAADIAGISLSGIRKMRAAGYLKGRRQSERKWEYQVAELLALATKARTHKTRKDARRITGVVR